MLVNLQMEVMKPQRLSSDINHNAFIVLLLFDFRFYAFVFGIFL